MKIGPSDNRPIAEGSARLTSRTDSDVLSKTPGSSNASTSAGGPAEASGVRFSSTAARFGAYGPADVDQDKVARVAQEIAQGRYRVNPQAIADQLIANAQAFMSERG